MFWGEAEEESLVFSGHVRTVTDCILHLIRGVFFSAVILGIICLGLTWVASKLGGILQVGLYTISRLTIKTSLIQLKIQFKKKHTTEGQGY